MQEAAREHWERAAQEDIPPDELEDFGFHYPLFYVLETGQLLVEYRIMPRPGGWDDQDYAWKEDMLVYMRGLAHARWENRRIPDPPDERPDWTKLEKHY